MTFPVHHLATFAIALHTALGCCFHHAHACEVNCCDAPAAMAEVCACDGQGHDESKQPGEMPRHNDRGRHDCQGDACIFAKTEQSGDELNDALHQSFAMPVVGVLQPPQAPDGQTADAPDTWLAVAGPPVRAHLLFQVLLI